MEDDLKKILAELELLRKIKMIELLERGYSQARLGAALGISQATVSRMMAGKAKQSRNKISDGLTVDA